MLTVQELWVFTQAYLTNGAPQPFLDRVLIAMDLRQASLAQHVVKRLKVDRMRA